jgi:hypothetical protein
MNEIWDDSSSSCGDDDVSQGEGESPHKRRSASCHSNRHAFSPQKKHRNGKMEKPVLKEKGMNIPSDVLENKASEIGRFWSYDEPLTAEARNLLFELLSFYDHENMQRLIVPRSIKSLSICKNYVLSDEMRAEINGISLRAIEWLVTNYSKGTKIVLFNEQNKNRIDIHNAYEIQSNYYKRNLFDPFCRHGRVFFLWKLRSIKTNEIENVIMMTTVGQLNFMKWADEQGILTYARQHQEKIQETMEITLSEVNREKKLFKKLGKTRKRKELTKEPNISCVVYQINTRLEFDCMDWDEKIPIIAQAEISLHDGGADDCGGASGGTDDCGGASGGADDCGGASGGTDDCGGASGGADDCGGASGGVDDCDDLKR